MVRVKEESKRMNLPKNHVVELLEQLCSLSAFLFIEKSSMRTSDRFLISNIVNQYMTKCENLHRPTTIIEPSLVDFRLQKRRWYFFVRFVRMTNLHSIRCWIIPQGSENRLTHVRGFNPCSKLKSSTFRHHQRGRPFGRQSLSSPLQKCRWGRP
jgi:hypothetical protein